MKRKDIRAVMLMILLLILAGSCLQKKSQTPIIQEKESKSSQTQEPPKLSEMDEKFYAELKKKLKNAQIHTYETPQAVPYLDFTLDNLNGEQVSLSDYEGTVILLNFWATWCGPCRAEMPSMEKLYNEMAEEGFVLIAVNLREDPGAVKKFAEKMEITFPILIDKTGDTGGAYGASSIPLSYLIDTKGYLVGAVLGTKVWNTKEIIDIIRFIQTRGQV